MMMKITTDDFAFAVMNSGASGEFYGEYHGRWGHEGIAVTLDSVGDLFLLGAALGEDDDLATICDTNPHIDNMGSGIIASWPLSLFDMPKAQGNT